MAPITTQDAADAAADSARDAAIAELQGEAQNAWSDNAMASAKAATGEASNSAMRKSAVPYGFEMYWGTQRQQARPFLYRPTPTMTMSMKNDEWSLQVNVKKTDSETGNQIAADAQYEIFQWDVVTGKYQPTGGYNTYSVQRQGDGSLCGHQQRRLCNHGFHAAHPLLHPAQSWASLSLWKPKRPTGYFGDWTDIDHPGTANTPLGKRGYYIEITAGQ